MRVLPVLLKRFSFDRKYRNATGGHRSRCMILGGKDVAGGPTHICTEFNQRFDENGGLNRHVQGPGNAGTLQRFLLAVLGTQRHQTGHFGLGDVQLLTTEIRLIEISDDVINCQFQIGRGCGRCHHELMLPGKRGVESLQSRRGFGLA